MTSERKNNLQQYKLVEEEWAIVRKLSDMLKVRMTSHFTVFVDKSTDPQRCYLILLTCGF